MHLLRLASSRTVAEPPSDGTRLSGMPCFLMFFRPSRGEAASPCAKKCGPCPLTSVVAPLGTKWHPGRAKAGTVPGRAEGADLRLTTAGWPKRRGRMAACMKHHRDLRSNSSTTTPGLSPSVAATRSKGQFACRVNCTGVTLSGRNASLMRQKKPYDSTPRNAIAASFLKTHRRTAQTRLP